MDLKYQLYLSLALLACRQSYAFISLTDRSRLIKSCIYSESDTSNQKYFEDLGLSDDIVGVASKMGWDHPTAVQQLSIPSILEMAESRDSNSLWCEVRKP